MEPKRDYTMEDVRGWVETFEYAWHNLVDKSLPFDRMRVVKLLLEDKILSLYFAFVNPTLNEEIEKICKQEFESERKKK
jgi:hypothetical protein